MSATVLETTTADATNSGDLRHGETAVHVVERVKDGRIYWVVDADPEAKVVTLSSRTGRRRFVDELTLRQRYRPLRRAAA